MMPEHTIHTMHLNLVAEPDQLPRDPYLAAMSDEDFLASYQEVTAQGHGVVDELDQELGIRFPQLRLVAWRVCLARHHDDKNSDVNPMTLKGTWVTSQTTLDLDAAYLALWQWIVMGNDAPLKARPGITAAETVSRAGISPDTWYGYVSRSQVPSPIGHEWHTGEKVWDRAVVEHWMASRRSGGRRRTVEARAQSK